MKIYKQIVKPEGIILEHCSEVLSVAEQRGEICVWYIHDEKLTQNVEITSLSTGEEYPGTYPVFVGTVLLEHGSLVFHIFAQYL